MPTAKPRLDLLRSLTDERVLRALMDDGRLTRADIAVRTGLSKPTASDSVRRLAEAGLLVDTGERTTGRGRAGTYYTLAPDVGTALVASIGPRGVVAETVDAFGRVAARVETGLDDAPGPERVARALAETAAAAAPGPPPRTAVLSAADPVDRATGRLVHLPDAPFLVGDLDPVAALRPLVDGPVLVDNDVNWAARAERSGGAAAGLDDFVYLHLGEGLGCAVVNDGRVRRGHHGFAGEPSHLIVPGPGGAAMTFLEVFGALDLRRPGGTAIDVGRLRAAPADARAVLARAVSAVLAAAVALADPELVVVGGPWGPDLLADVEAEYAAWPRSVPLAAATVPDPELTAARARAVTELRTLIIDAVRPAPE